MQTTTLPNEIIINIMHNFTSVSEFHKLFSLNKNVSHTCANLKNKYSIITNFCNNVAKKRFAMFFARELQKNLPMHTIHEYSAHWDNLHHMLMDCIVIMFWNYTEERWSYMNPLSHIPARKRKCILVNKIVKSQSWYSECVVSNRKTYVDCVYRTTMGKTLKIKKQPVVAALVY